MIKKLLLAILAATAVLLGGCGGKGYEHEILQKPVEVTEVTCTRPV